MKKDKLLNLILPLITLSCLLLIWAMGAVVTDSEYILPSIGLTLRHMLNLFGSGKFYTALFFTIKRSVISFLLSFVISAVFAFLANKSKVAERLILPLISIIRALPTLAVILLLLFWTKES